MTSIAAGEAGARSDVDVQADGAAGDDTRPRTDRHPVHRLRALPRRERAWAFVVALAVLAAPAAAFAAFVPDWTPAADPALMGLRSLDVGTATTPLLGQPSQSRLYADSVASVHHPGPLHFYLMALPIRLLGAPIGMPLVSVLITGSCLVVSAWAVFRQLGRTAGLVAAVALSLVAFTTGASSLIHPVSSSIAGYPLLCTAVLWWCVAAGDIRLLPLAVAAASFTAQQHLSVVPATAVLVGGGVALLALRWRRDGHWSDRADRRALARWFARSGAVAAVLWAPVLIQQAFGESGNLGDMLWFAQHGNSDSLGLGSAVRQLAHVAGLPPLLGRTDLTGGDLLVAPSLFTWVSAVAVLGAAGLLCLRWRRHDPRRASLGAAVGLVVAAGLVNGASVPRGLEQGRLSFYHWAFALSFLLVLIVGLAVAPALARVALPGRAWVRPALAGVAVVAVLVPTAVNPAIDRRTNTLRATGAPVEHAAIAHLADAVEAEGDRSGAHTLLLSRHEPVFAGVAPALSFELAQRGIEVHHPLIDRFFVNDRRLVDRDELDGGLVVMVDTQARDGDVPRGGELLAEVDTTGGDEQAFDVAAYRSLVAAATDADELRLSPAAERSLDELDDADREAIMLLLESVIDEPGPALRNPWVLALLRDLAPAEPALDPAALQRVIDTVDDYDPQAITGLRLYRLDRDDTLDLAFASEVGRR